jgi:carboxymethylenebutenolidase
MTSKSLKPDPAHPVSRRDFLVTMLASGFALAVQPVTADTITTDSNGLEAGEVQIKSGTDTIPAYRAMPAGGANLPIALVVQEIFGVHEHIKDICRRLAKQGYLAVAPELYARQGDVSKLKDIKEIIETVVSKVPDAQVMDDLDATAKWAGENKGDPGKLAITGFCWGGRIVWLYCAHSDKVKAGVAWYGRLKGKTDPLHPKYPIDSLFDLKGPVLGLYGGQDDGIPVADIDDMKSIMLRAGNPPAQFVVYPEAGHGFNADYRSSYNQQAAEDGWKRMLEWFKQHGVA